MLFTFVFSYTRVVVHVALKRRYLEVILISVSEERIAVIVFNRVAHDGVNLCGVAHFAGGNLEFTEGSVRVVGLFHSDDRSRNIGLHQSGVVIVFHTVISCNQDRKRRVADV